MDEQTVHAADPVLDRIQGEYREMPGLRLTSQQAQRLWGLDSQTCLSALELLVNSGFLWRAGDGTFRRLEGASGPSPFRMARAGARSKAIWGGHRPGPRAVSGQR
jgi:hypothetical protein